MLDIGVTKIYYPPFFNFVCTKTIILCVSMWKYLYNESDLQTPYGGTT